MAPPAREAESGRNGKSYELRDRNSSSGGPSAAPRAGDSVSRGGTLASRSESSAPRAEDTRGRGGRRNARSEIAQRSGNGSRTKSNERGEGSERYDGAGSPERYSIQLDASRIDPDAAKVVMRLVRHGYEGYLVGGCVRDLLLDSSPKDFDVATNARPDDVRYLFKNSRIIGRRFRLVHVLFSNGKIIETATFRKPPPPSGSDELLIRDDNAFGEAHEDAVRRDFTINGLFYDLETNQVIDWVGGIPDVRARTVRTIGDPVVRFLEDPVRILRAIKFSARLDLGIAPEVYDAMVQCRGSLAMASRPRLFEEIMRLLRCGASHRALWLAWETGVLDVLLPELSAYLLDVEEPSSLSWALFSALDNEVRERGKPFDDIVLLTVLLFEPLLEACEGRADRLEASIEFLEPIVERLAVPRRIADGVRRIVAVLPRLERNRPGRFAKTALYVMANQVHQLAHEAKAIASSL